MTLRTYTLKPELPPKQSTYLDPVGATFLCRELYLREEFRHEKLLVDLICHVNLIVTIYEEVFRDWAKFVKMVNSAKILKSKVRRDLHRDRVPIIVCRVVFRSIGSYDRAYKMARIVEFYRALNFSEKQIREEIEAIGGIEKAYQHVCRTLPYKGKTRQEKLLARSRLANGITPLYPEIPSEEGDNVVVAGLEEALTTSFDKAPILAASPSRSSSAKMVNAATFSDNVVLEVSMTIEELSVLKKMPANEDIQIVIRNVGMSRNKWVTFDLVSF